MLEGAEMRAPCRASAAVSATLLPYAAMNSFASATGVAPAGQSTYDEQTGAASKLSFEPGWTLMKWFLGEMTL